MTFEQPMLLWGLLALPLALAAYLLTQRRRARYAVRFTNLDLLASVVQSAPGWRRHLPPALYLGALAALLIALARPQATVPVPRDQATVMLVMDVSGSMEATDVQPSRIVAAKSAARSFLDQLPDGFRVGLVSFSSEARTLAPPTADRSTVRRAIEDLRPGGGTAMGDGLAHALETGAAATQAASAPTPVPSPASSGQPPTAEQPPLAVVLLSDGANTLGRTEPAQAAQRAQQMGVPVFTIALGTPGGTLDLVQGGRRTSMRVPPDERTLQQIAETSGGRFFRAPTEEDLRTVYQSLGSRIGFVEERQEVTVLFAAGALALMLAGSSLALAWFNRFP
jgi:Ca-activated chloride channel homolog